MVFRVFKWVTASGPRALHHMPISDKWNPDDSGCVLFKVCSGDPHRSQRMVQEICIVQTDFIIKVIRYLPFTLSFSHECPEEFSRGYMTCDMVAA